MSILKVPRESEIVYELNNQQGDRVCGVFQNGNQHIGVFGIGMVVDDYQLFASVGSSIVKDMVHSLLYSNVDDELFSVSSTRDESTELARSAFKRVNTALSTVP